MNDYGLKMEPLLLCSGCNHSSEPQPIASDITGDVECPNCSAPMMLVSVGIIQRKVRLTDLTRWGIDRARGTWWR